MRDLKSVKRTLLVLCAICLTVVSCQDVVQKNEPKTVDLQDPEVDGTVKSALENGSVSEVVVRKDLLLFPVNAPNLVIAHRQEIHAVPQSNGSNEADGKPTEAQIAEVNEYSLSQLVSTNDTDNQNESAGGSVPMSSSPFSTDSQNSTILAPGKLLEIPSGFNLTDGLATEKVALPDEVQNISVPKQSIMDILSKSLAQQETTMTPNLPSSYEDVKRSVDSSEEDREGNGDSDSVSVEQNKCALENTTAFVKRSINSDESTSVENDNNSSSVTPGTEGGTSSTTSTSTMETVKRSVDSDESISVENDSSSSTTISTTKSGTSSIANTSTSTTTKKVEKRSIEGDDDGDDDSTSNSTEYYDHEVKRYSKRHISGTTSSLLKSSSQRNKKEYPSNFRQETDSLREDSAKDMDVAEDIVFRPLFRYRQETQLKHQSSNNRRRAYSDYDDDYANQDKTDYN